SPVRLNPDLPAELERIINRALEKDRDLRYQHASEIRAELQRLKRDTDSSRSAVGPAEDIPLASSDKHGGVPASGATVPASSSSVAAAPQKKGRRWIVPAAIAFAVVLAGGLLFHSRKSSALTEKDSILLADFMNTTGDPVFDGTLKQALAVQL